MLYKVITEFDPSAAAREAPGSLDPRRNRRITSYNVCYTKLLRLRGGRRDPAADLVIVAADEQLPDAFA